MNSKLLTPLVIKGTQPPLFIVPAIGTTAFSLIKLARSLKTECPVYSFELPEIKDNFLPYNSIEEIASIYVDEIMLAHPTGPYYLAGHCGGATIALEITKQIESKSSGVALLILLEAITPKIANNFSGGDKTGSPPVSVSMERALQTIIEHMSNQLELLPKVVAEKFKKVCIQMLRMAEQYRATSIKAPIIHIRTRTHSARVYEGWDKITMSGINEYIVSGDAYSMLTPPVIETLVEILDLQLRKV